MLEVEHVTHRFINGDEVTTVLHDVDFKVEKGEIVSLLGSSGSGKSTLLNLMAGLMKPLEGEIRIGGAAIHKMSENELAEFRRGHIGFIFQSYELIPHLTVRENVEMPLMFQKVRRENGGSEHMVWSALDSGARRTCFRLNCPAVSSSVRVYARALIAEPDIVFADEPTGDLDTKTEREIMDLLLELNEGQGLTFVIVTHEQEVARRTRRVMQLRDGKLYFAPEGGL